MNHIAIMGCGQLAQMLARSAIELQCSVVFIAAPNEATVCVEGLGEIVHLSVNDDAEKVYERLGRPAVVTVEREDVDIQLLRELKRYCAVYPDPQHIYITQHRSREKHALTELGLPVASYCDCDSKDDVARALVNVGFPAYIKFNEQGYDGKNQWRISDWFELESLGAVLGQASCVVEAAVEFKSEHSMIAVRSSKGEKRFYTLTENTHYESILRTSFAPLQPDLRHSATAVGYISKILDQWGYVGVLTLECFETETGLVVNELAPRVHNSGHWSLDCATTSQFENHIRAILGMSLGSTASSSCGGMVNLIGLDTAPDIISEIGKIYWYGKSLRAGRKMGHINFISQDQQQLQQKLADTVKQLLYVES